MWARDNDKVNFVSNDETLVVLRSEAIVCQLAHSLESLAKAVSAVLEL